MNVNAFMSPHKIIPMYIKKRPHLTVRTFQSQ